MDLKGKECSKECIGNLGRDHHSCLLYSLTPKTESSLTVAGNLFYNRNDGYVDGLLPVYILYINILIHCQSLK